MSTTALAQIYSSLPQSSDQKKDVWDGYAPKDLLEAGYAEHVDFAPSHVPPASWTETRVEDPTDDDNPTSTVLSSTSFKGALIVQLPPSDPMPQTRWVSMHPLQEWEGFVVEAGDEEFTARLWDLTNGSSSSQAGQIEEEEAVISLSEISEDDVRQLHPGSIFRWVIGFERTASGTKRRVSQIVFRDVPAMTDQDRSQGAAWATEVMQSILD